MTPSSDAIIYVPTGTQGKHAVTTLIPFHLFPHLLFYHSQQFFLHKNQRQIQFLVYFSTMSWSVISTLLSWVCSSLRACWARLLEPTADACWKFVWMASIRKISISRIRAAVLELDCKEQRQEICLT